MNNVNTVSAKESKKRLVRPDKKTTGVYNAGDDAKEAMKRASSKLLEGQMPERIAPRDTVQTSAGKIRGAFAKLQEERHKKQKEELPAGLYKKDWGTGKYEMNHMQFLKMYVDFCVKDGDFSAGINSVCVLKDGLNGVNIDHTPPPEDDCWVEVQDVAKTLPIEKSNNGKKNGKNK